MKQTRIHSETGAVFIHVGIGLLVFLGFTAFVVDYGLMMVSRNQAQARRRTPAHWPAPYSLAFDDAMPATAGTARAMWPGTPVYQHGVWGAGAGRRCPEPVRLGHIAMCDSDRSVHPGGRLPGRINGSSTLPTLFAELFGTDTQPDPSDGRRPDGARVGPTCMKPWADS